MQELAGVHAKELPENRRDHVPQIPPIREPRQKKNPRNLSGQDMVKLVNAMKNYDGFLSLRSHLSLALGEDLLETGIKKELGITDQEIQTGSAFVTTLQRRPATYAGFPFIIEVGLASSKQIETQGKISIQICQQNPLLFDEASDVSWKVVDTEIDWRNYKVVPGETPLGSFRPRLQYEDSYRL